MYHQFGARNPCVFRFTACDRCIRCAVFNLRTDEPSLDKMILENAEVVYGLTALAFEGKSVMKQLKSARSHNL